MKSIKLLSILFFFGYCNIYAITSDSVSENLVYDKEHLNLGGNKLTFYGFLRLDAVYSDSKMNHNQFSMFALREDSSLGDKSNDEFIDIYPRLSRFGFTIERDSIPMWESAKLTGKLELDWQNRATTEAVTSESRQLPRLRHSYLEITKDDFSILAGQTSDVVSPLYPSVHTDAIMWNTGNLGDRRPQIRFGYEPLIGNKLKGEFHVALARTGAIDRKDLDGDGFRDGDDSGIPMVQARAGIDRLLHNKLKIGLWGHQGWEETSTKISGKDNFKSISIGLDFSATPVTKLNVNGELFSGKNLSDIRGGIGQGINITTADEIQSEGGWIELIYRFTDWYKTSIGYGQDNPDDDDLPTGGRKLNKAFWWGNKFDLGGGLIFGVEIIHWETSYKNQDEGTANRYNLIFQYNF